MGHQLAETQSQTPAADAVASMESASRAMRRWLTVIGTLVTVTLMAAIMLTFGSAATITLVADEPIEVHDLPNVDPAKTQVIGMLKAGEEVAVVDCEDLKDYIVPKIVLPDGRNGFVFVGRFRLRREPPWSSPGKPTALGCPAPW